MQFYCACLSLINEAYWENTRQPLTICILDRTCFALLEIARPADANVRSIPPSLLF